MGSGRRAADDAAFSAFFSREVGVACRADGVSGLSGAKMKGDEKQLPAAATKNTKQHNNNVVVLKFVPNSVISRHHTHQEQKQHHHDRSRPNLLNPSPPRRRHLGGLARVDPPTGARWRIFLRPLASEERCPPTSRPSARRHGFTAPGARVLLLDHYDEAPETPRSATTDTVRRSRAPR